MFAPWTGCHSVIVGVFGDFDFHCHFRSLLSQLSHRVLDAARDPCGPLDLNFLPAIFALRRDVESIQRPDRGHPIMRTAQALSLHRVVELGHVLEHVPLEVLQAHCFLPFWPIHNCTLTRYKAIVKCKIGENGDFFGTAKLAEYKRKLTARLFWKELVTAFRALN